MDDCNPIPCNCKDGKQGIQGLKGPFGDQGATGSIGLEGPVGPQGIPGIDGEQGIVGNQGVDGADGTSTVVGPAGPQGPDGPDGPQGPDGLDGTDGIDGTAGAHGCGVAYSTRSGVANYSEISGTPVPAQVYALNPNGCGSVIFNKTVGNGFFLTALPAPGGSIIGDRVRFVGSIGGCEWRLGGPLGTRFEMAAFNSFVNNISSSGPSLASPFFGYGLQNIQFPQPNAGDTIEIVYIGDNHWVVVEANLANGQLPVFT